jgi:hypothetical protein
MDVVNGGGIPVVDSNNDDCVGSSGDGDNHRNHNTKSAPCRCLLLEFLPRELLAQSILGGRYLNGNDLSNFWCAAAMSTKKIIRTSTIEDMIRIIRHRRTLLTTEEQTTMTMEERNSNEEQDNDQDNEDDNVNDCDYARRLVFRAFEEAITAINDDDGDSDDDDDDDDDRNERISSFSLRNFLRLSRHIFGNLSAIDYCENVPSNLIWCGILQFRNKGYEKKEEKIQVVLVTHPRRWSVEQIRLWRNATTTMATTTSSSKTTMMHNNETTAAAITVDVIPYNFVPVGPRRGRLVGVTKSDRRSLRQLSQKLDETELVGRFACKNTGRRSTNNNNDIRGGSFNVKLISFAQGQRKLDNTFRQGREPGGIPLNEEKISMTLRQKSKTHHHTENTLLQDNDDDPDDATDNDRNTLLCCWDHDISWDEEENFTSIRIAETPLTLRDTMREYNKLCTL